MGDVEMLDRSRRCLACNRRYSGRPALGDDDPSGTGKLSRAADRSQVAWVLDLVKGDEQRVLPPQQPTRVCVGVGIDLGDNALVVR